MSKLNFHIISKYYDVTDPGNPVKRYYYDSIEIPASPYTYGYVNIRIVKNEYRISSGWNWFSEPVTKSFYSIEEHQNSFQQRNPINGRISSEIIAARFEAHYEIRVFETTLLTFIDIFGMVGGVFEILQVTAGFILGIITDKMLRRDVAKATIKKYRKLEEKEDNIYSKWFSYPPENPEDKKENEKKIKEEKMKQRRDIEESEMKENQDWIK
mmetsp:Transcript_11118/g.9844  ORF Transcript_11118/g.9844 Transcript_11118/m.9844 type:complete len:212 (+) Transcript_11118:675-1310(+)